MKQGDIESQDGDWHRASRLLRFSACSVLFFGIIAGGFVLTQWSLGSGEADDFQNGRGYAFWYFTEPGAEIGICIILAAGLISWLILRKAYSKRTNKRSKK